jgi:hypothetical protein
MRHEQLERHAAFQHLVVRGQHDAHAASTELLLDAVATVYDVADERKSWQVGIAVSLQARLRHDGRV